VRRIVCPSVLSIPPSISMKSYKGYMNGKILEKRINYGGPQKQFSLGQMVHVRNNRPVWGNSASL
jgi:hypothetical protein